ncbi:MAG TPA: enoyl-CoA hydratase-related protein [Pyrinomonadaceae bacterium]|nr:enoyl-CoA hydratase-related protein [Pyrinomonadaceae bacterium]
MNTYKVVLSSIDGPIARITLNRPEKKNALNDELIAELQEALRTAATNESVRVVLIAANGSDFCSGADLSALEKISKASAADNAADARALLELFVLIRQLPVPVVAAVHGRALAGGCGLATACDIALASENAQFGYPEVKLGFVPAMVTAILRRNVSEKLAFELLTRGNTIGSREALRIGLINRVFTDETFENEVDEYLKTFSSTSRSAVSLTKTLLYQVDGMPFLEAIETGADVNVIARMTEDCQKGIARFLSRQKRTDT